MDERDPVDPRAAVDGVAVRPDLRKRVVAVTAKHGVGAWIHGAYEDIVASAAEDGAFAGIEDDSRGSRVAHLPGLETVVDRASQSRDGAGCRRRIGIVCRTECVSQEELPVGVFLSHSPHQDQSTAGRLA